MGITEEFLHYVWENRLFSLPLELADGTGVTVLDTGMLNRDSGPDFFNAKIRIRDLTWAGNIEIHLKASDWNRHGHHLDQAYDNVILHLVLEQDCDVYTSKGTRLPSARLCFPDELYQRYKELLETRSPVPCRDNLRGISPLTRALWIGRLGIERLEQRARELEAMMAGTGGDWTETVYRQLLKSFGYKINALPFELLARSLPYTIVKSSSGHLHQLEALLFGQAGLLPGTDSDPYRLGLFQEYARMQQTYRLSSINRSLWKYLRLYPAAFPTVRIAQLAALLHKHPGLVNQLLDINYGHGYLEYFAASASSYWSTHYLFGKSSRQQVKTIGVGLKRNVIINALVPLQYLYGRKTGSLVYRERSIDLLEKLPAERNAIIRAWERSGFDPENAFSTQALLHLTNNYCNFGQCLACRFGTEILKRSKKWKGERRK